jgi:hypothetical protein
MHSHQRIGITSSRTTDTGVFFREDGKEWLGGKENASRLSGTLQNSEENIFCFFYFTILCPCLPFFSSTCFFCFYDTSIGKQITSKKEEESNTTSLTQNAFISGPLFFPFRLVFMLTTVLDDFGRPTDDQFQHHCTPNPRNHLP